MSDKFIKAKHFNFDPNRHFISEIIKFLELEGFKVLPSKRMAYHLQEYAEKDTIGYWIDGLDISIENEYDHPFHGLVGRIDMASSMEMKFPSDLNCKIFNKLKKKFSMSKDELNKRANLPPDLC